MRHIPFLKDALYLRPETEAVEELLEGLPREIVRLESLGLGEEGKMWKGGERGLVISETL